MDVWARRGEVDRFTIVIKFPSSTQKSIFAGALKAKGGLDSHEIINTAGCDAMEKPDEMLVAVQAKAPESSR